MRSGLTAQLRRAIREGCDTGTDWPSRVAGGLRALLGRLSCRAELAEALARSGEGRTASAATELPAEVEMLAVGAAEAIVFEQIQAGRTAELRTLGPDILFSVLVPFLGATAAAEAMEAERQRGPTSSAG